jgi:hypothetical protein
MGTVQQIVPGITDWDEFVRRVHRTAVQYLLDEGNEPEAMALLSCDMRAWESQSWGEPRASIVSTLARSAGRSASGRWARHRPLCTWLPQLAPALASQSTQRTQRP